MFSSPLHKVKKKKRQKSVSLQTVLDEAGKLVKFINFELLNTHLFNVLCDETWSMPKTLLLPLGVPWLSKDVFPWCISLQLFELWADLAPFHGRPFLFEWITDRQIMVILTWVFGRYFLDNDKWACYFKKNKWQYLLPKRKFQLSREN